MADTEEKDKKPEENKDKASEEKKDEKPKMTTGILILLAILTLMFVLIAVLLFEGRTPAGTAGAKNPGAVSAERGQPAAETEKVPFREWICKKIRIMLLMKTFYESGVSAGDQLRGTMRDLVGAWGRLLNAEKAGGEPLSPTAPAEVPPAAESGSAAVQ